MSAPVDSSHDLMPVSASTGASHLSQADTSDRVCWVEIKQYQYQPDHQVELLHLQAEADALLLQLQAIRQRRRPSGSEN